MSSSKVTKKKVTLTDAQKYELCLYANNNKKTRPEYVEWVEEKWGVKIDKSTVTRILQNKEKHLSDDQINSTQKRHRSVTFPELELALKEFVLRYQDKAILSDSILIEKAKQLATGLGVPENTLLFSSGWLYGFKKRNGIQQEKLQGEAASANEIAIEEALPLLQNKCANYTLERIYNMDETGLFYRYKIIFFYKIQLFFITFLFLILYKFIIIYFILYRLEPDHSLATRRLSGRKKNKERLSIALCTNADGSHKLPPLIIGKYANPRCFKTINIHNLPITYRHNSKAWMLTTLFQEWLCDFNNKIAIKHNGKRVLLLLDNCGSHKIEGLNLSHVDVHFLPPNTTSRIQPLDAGIIMSFKRHYRNHHIR
jgi:hypothetical protein